MPHKLLIAPNLVVEPGFRELLSFNETVAARPMVVELHIRNIGEKAFPGGEISGGRFTFQTPLGIGIFKQERRADPSKIPNIPPRDIFVVKCAWYPASPGLWEIGFKINAVDEEKIEYYQSETELPALQDRWAQYIYAVDRHQLDSILLLKELLKKR